MYKEMDLEDIRVSLTSWFEKKMPEASGISLSPLKRPVAGTSNDTFFKKNSPRSFDIFLTLTIFVS